MHTFRLSETDTHTDKLCVVLQDLDAGPSWNECNECRRVSGREVTSPFPLEHSPLSCSLLPIG